MNQILSSDGENNNNVKKQNQAIKKIIIIFSIIISIFGIILIGLGVTSLAKKAAINSNNNKQPSVNIVQNDDKINIKIEHDKSISVVRYNWNNEKKEEIQGSGRSKIEKELKLPEGENVLNVEVIDVNGITNTFSKKYSFGGTDNGGPEIEIFWENEYLKIVATDNKKMQSLTYKWDNEEEKILEPDASDVKKIETRIEIKQGEHTIKIIAKDSDGNIAEKEQTLRGVKPPKIEVVNKNGTLEMKITDEEGITEIVYKLNGKEVTIDGENKKEIIKNEKLINGKNTLTITATNIHAMKKELEAYCEYNQ